MEIKILKPEVASQIAAGEVVERPASVVKELMENALDAGATQISIQIVGAGQTIIEVADDGQGIPPGELHLAVERHATSKIESADQLHHIQTLGFRGEALASIGSVSRLTITAKDQASSAAAQLFVEGGQISPIREIGAPVGTLVRVEDLFYNVPARKKFLKKDVTERRQITALVTRYALAYDRVRFTLAQEGKQILQTAGDGDARTILANLYGVEIARQMVEVNAVFDDLEITGYISPIGVTRGNRTEMTFFVNGRWVKDASLTAALTRAYHTLLMVGRYPIAVLFLKIDPALVDVNVHPAKSEVRFEKKDRVFADLQRSIRRTLLAYTPLSEVAGYGHPPSGPENPAGSFDNFGRSSGQQQGWNFRQVDRKGAQEPGEIRQSPLPQAEKIPLLRLIGQIASTYLVAEGPDGLYLVDQHAAHERVLYEKFLAEISDSLPSQALLEPAVVELGNQEASILEDQLQILSSLGFSIEAFGRNSFIVRSMPVILQNLSPLDAVKVLVEDFEEDETPLQGVLENKIIARVCKRAAVKAGQVLSNTEQLALLLDLEASNSPRTCPHGRPTMIHISVDLLERQFGRRGPR